MAAIGPDILTVFHMTTTAPDAVENAVLGALSTFNSDLSRLMDDRASLHGTITTLTAHVTMQETLHAADLAARAAKKSALLAQAEELETQVMEETTLQNAIGSALAEADAKVPDIDIPSNWLISLASGYWVDMARIRENFFGKKLDPAAEELVRCFNFPAVYETINKTYR